MKQKTAAERDAERVEQADRAVDYAHRLCGQAALRGMNGEQVFEAFVVVLTARNPTLAGKILAATMDAVQAYPVPRLDALDMTKGADGSWNLPAHGAAE